MAMTSPPSPHNPLMGITLIPRLRDTPIEFGVDMFKIPAPLIYYRLGPIDSYTVTTPELVHEILVKKARSFYKWDRQKQIFGKFDGDGLVNSDGDFWRRQRKLMQPAFHHKRLQHYADVMAKHTLAHLERWQSGEVLEMGSMMSLITRDIVAETLFGADVSAYAEQIGEAMDTIQHMAFREMGELVSLPDWTPLPHKRREKAAMETLDRVVMEMIERRRASTEDGGDLLSMLLAARDENGEGMTDQQVRDEVTTLFIAGHETTATAMAWVWYVLAQHPEVYAKLQAEVDALEGRVPGFADLPNLRYAEQVIKETMRLYPSTYLFPRQVHETVEIGGYTLKPGAIVHFFIYAFHHDARYFPEPELFRPERFAPENKHSIPEYAYLPFGAGPRVCIGNSFAMMEMQLMLALVMQRFEIALAPGQGVPELEQLIVLRPKGGMHVRVTARERQPVTL